MMSWEKRQPALCDTDIMPFGLHKGKPMQDVPPKYLMWLYDNIRQSGITTQNELVYNYIHNNMDAIRMELEL